jgi:hypothetical protein
LHWTSGTGKGSGTAVSDHLPHNDTSMEKKVESFSIVTSPEKSPTAMVGLNDIYQKQQTVLIRNRSSYFPTASLSAPPNTGTWGEAIRQRR